MDFLKAFGNHRISFGDQVRIVSTELTETLSLAGLTGTVFGQTKPSHSQVEVIGTSGDDYAVNVFFADRGEGFWFKEELVELVSACVVHKITIDGVDVVLTPSATDQQPSQGRAVPRKSWWQRFGTWFQQ